LGVIWQEKIWGRKTTTTTTTTGAVIERVLRGVGRVIGRMDGTMNVGAKFAPSLPFLVISNILSAGEMSAGNLR